MKDQKVFLKRLILTVFTIAILINTAMADNQRTVLKLATLGQKGISAMIYLDKTFFPGLTKATDGQVKFDVYWGGVMGDEEDYIGKMRTGQLQGAFVGASGGIADMVCPDISVMSLPFLFNAWAWDEVNYVKNKIRSHVYMEAKKRGYKFLIIANVGFDQIYSTEQNIETIEDIKAAKILTWYGLLENKMLQALGVSPIPVNVPEVVTSIKTGICNMAISPSLWWVGAQLYPDTKYVNPLPLRYVPGMFILTLEAWNKISEKHRDAMNALFSQYEIDFQNTLKICNEKAYKAMIKYGLKEATRPVWDELAGSSYSPTRF